MNHSERSSVPKRSQESYRKVWNIGREPRVRDNVRGSAMSLMYHISKTLECKMKDWKQLMEKSDKSSNVKNGKRKRCSYHRTSSHSNKDCYQQQSESENLDNNKMWCTYHERKPFG